jgi:hypothetical protein
LISEYPDKTGQQHLEQIADELSHLQRDVVINGGIETLNNLLDKNILYVAN